VNLGAAAGERPARTAHAPERRRELTIRALRSWALAKAAKRPVLLIVEDLQWVDPSSLELLSALADSQLRARLVLLVATRPDRPPPWPPAGHVLYLRLERLAPTHVRELVEAITGQRPIPEQVLEEIVTRSDGVPLYAEELTWLAVEEGDGPETSVPAKVYGLLRTTLDRLGADLDLARLCSVLGRDFQYPLLRTVAKSDEVSLQRGLLALVDRGVLVAQQAGARYAFRHALLRDAAYESLLRPRRRELHHAVAATLVGDFPEVAARHPEELARHWTEANALEEAIVAWARAAAVAGEHFAVPEAMAHLNQALELVARLPESPARDRHELMLLLSLGPFTLRAFGGGDERVQAIYRRAMALCEHLDQTPERFMALQGIYAYWTARPDHGRSGPIGDSLVDLAAEQGRAGMLLHAHAWRGSNAYLAGDRTRAQHHLAACLEGYDPSRNPTDPFDPGVTAMGFMAFVEWDAGRPGPALAAAQRARDLAQSRGHPFTVAYAALHAAKLHVRRRDATTAGELADLARTVAIEHGFEQLRPQAECILGWATALAGKPAPGAEMIEAGLRDIARSGSMADASLHQLLLVEARWLAGDVPGAVAAADDAKSFIEASGERAYESDLHRMRGELAARSSVEAARDSLWLAVRTAKEQQARFSYLRAALSLHRKYPGDETTEALAGALDLFAESDDPEVRQARQALGRDAVSEGR
jgi:hypothetical protein